MEPNEHNEDEGALSAEELERGEAERRAEIAWDNEVERMMEDDRELGRWK